MCAVSICSPVKDTVVSNDRWGDETMCKIGGVISCLDRFNPGNEKYKHSSTLQTFYSCTGRSDIDQCLVVHTPMDNMSKKLQAHQ